MIEADVLHTKCSKILYNLQQNQGDVSLFKHFWLLSGYKTHLKNSNNWKSFNLCFHIFLHWYLGCFKCAILSCDAVQTFEAVYGQKIIHAKIQSNRLINDLAQALWSLEIFVWLLINGVFFGRLLFYPSSFDVKTVYIMKQKVRQQHLLKAVIHASNMCGI